MTATMNSTLEQPVNHLLEIEARGQSIWMDNLTRDLVVSGELKRLIQDRGLQGITSNPAIFEKAIVGNKIYDADIEAGLKAGKSTLEIYESLIFEDIRNACDIFLPVYQSSSARDGYISIEVPPTIAHSTDETITAAQRYYQELGRENVMIKIPGTPEGLPAVEAVIAAGINVNVTLLFSVQSYIDTAWAYIRGLEQRAAQGLPVNNIASVASFFLSRIDSNIDARLDARLAAQPSPEAEAKLQGLKGQIAIANAKLAYQAYKQIIATDRWQALAAKGAQVQRLLWASTSTKNPSYSDVMYVDNLIGMDTVNTLPPATIEACADHCNVADRIEADLELAQTQIASLKDPEVGIDLDQVMDELLADGIEKFIQPFDTLMQAIGDKAKQLVTA
jgi:transaldolase